jgi:hypothetical protein
VRGGLEADDHVPWDAHREGEQPQMRIAAAYQVEANDSLTTFAGR